jgi:hypothetical protein
MGPNKNPSILCQASHEEEKTSHKVDITLKGGYTCMVPLHKNSEWEINKYKYQIKTINVELLAGIFF